MIFVKPCGCEVEFVQKDPNDTSTNPQLEEIMLVPCEFHATHAQSNQAKSSFLGVEDGR